MTDGAGTSASGIDAGGDGANGIDAAGINAPGTNAPGAGARSWRAWASVGFALHGFIGAVVLTNLPGLQKRTGIGDTEVSLVVLAVLLMAAVGSLTAGWIAPRRGSGSVLAPAFLVQAAAVLLAMLPLPYLALFPVYALFGLGVGLADAGNGMQALVIQRAHSRPIVSMFFAFQTAAAIVGALLVAGVNGSGLPFEVGFALAATAAIALAVLLRTRLAPDPEVEVAESAKPPLPWRGILIFGLVITVVYVGDGVVSTWSSVFLDTTLLASAAVVPLGYAAYQACVLVARLAGDRLVVLLGRPRVVGVAAVVAAGGLFAAAVSPTPWLAVAAFGLTGLGLGVIVPLSFAAAGELAPDRIDEIVARLNLFNYLGVLLGAALTGVIADALGMRVALAVPVLLIAAVLFAVRSYAPRRAAAA